MTTWNRTGTVTVTNGSPTVTGSVVSWSNVAPGDAFHAPDGEIYEIASVTGSTITLVANYGGSTASGQAYAIQPTRGVLVPLRQQIADLITQVNADGGALKRNNNLSDLPSAAAALTNLGVTATAAELNILDGATLSTTELNILDGATLSTTELNILDGMTASTAQINQLTTNTFATLTATTSLTSPLLTNAGTLNISATSGGEIRAFTGGSERLRLTSDGSLQIGSDSALRPSVLVYDNDTTDAALIVRQDGSAAGQIWQGASGVEFMRLNSSGNLLVGRDSNNTYAGNVHATGFSSVGANQFNIQAASSGASFEWVLRSGAAMDFYVNNASVMASLSSSGVWTNASDRRHKENIKPSTYGLEEVMRLEPRAYNIIGSERQEIGFIAQEVQTIVPELVESINNSVTNEERLTLSYGQLTAVLVKAIQDQQGIIAALEARMSALEGMQ